jgi:hypothetical protein
VSTQLHSHDLNQELFQIGMRLKLAGSMAAPLLGATALGLPLAGYLGMRYGESQAEQAAKQRALTGFGAGIATGVAAPRLIGKLQSVLNRVQSSGGPPGYAKMGSAQQYPHLELLFEKQAKGGKARAALGRVSDWLGGLNRPAAKAKKPVARYAAPKGSTPAKPPGKKKKLFGKKPEAQPRYAQPQPKAKSKPQARYAPPASAPKAKAAPKEPKAPDATRAMPAGQQAAARRASQPKAAPDATRAMAAPDQAMMQRASWLGGMPQGAPDMSAAAKAMSETPGWHYAAMAGLPLAGVGIGYSAGQHEAENRPLMQRVFPG